MVGFRSHDDAPINVREASYDVAVPGNYAYKANLVINFTLPASTYVYSHSCTVLAASRFATSLIMLNLSFHHFPTPYKGGTEFNSYV
jgi:hypothetical protein